MPILSSDTMEFISRSAAQTQRVGARLGALLQGGDVIALEGDLATGKTVFAQGVGLGWGATSRLISPTFIIIRRHSRPQDDLYLYHADLYRLETGQEVTDLGFEEMLGDPGGVCIVEWADRAPNIFPVETLGVTLQWLDEQRRSLTFRASGTRHRNILENLRKEIIGR